MTDRADIRFDYYPSVKAKKAAKQITLGELDQITLGEGDTGPAVKAAVAGVRAIPDQDARQDEKQRALPAVTPSLYGAAQRRKALDHGGVLNGVITFDIDHLAEQGSSPSQVKAALADKLPWVFYAITSPSGDGVKLFGQTAEPPESGADFSALQRALTAEVRSALGVKVDSTPDPNRLLYLSHDPEPYRQKKAQPVGVPGRTPSSHPPDEQTGGQLEELEAAKTAAADELKRITADIAEAKKREAAEQNRSRIDALYASGGVFSVTPEGLLDAMEHVGFERRYNTRLGADEVRGGYLSNVQLDDWTPVDRQIKADVRMRLREGCLRYGKLDKATGEWGEPEPYWIGAVGLWDALWDAAARLVSVDPFLDFVEAQEEPQPGDARLEDWLPTIFDVENETLARWAGPHLWIGAVQRAYEPGSVHRMMPVLISDEEGIGKSLIYKTMFPKDQQELWFTDSLDIRAKLFEKVAVTEGAVVVELAECAGLNRHDNNEIKSYLTSTADKVRKRHDREGGVVPRRFVFGGTSNDDMPLPSHSKNTRFVPIRLLGLRAGFESGQVIVDHMNEVRGQLWADALQRYRAGARVGVIDDPVIKHEAEAAAADFTYRIETLESHVADFLRERREPFLIRRAVEAITAPEPDEFTDTAGKTHRIFPNLPRAVSAATEGQIKAALKTLGWTAPTRRQYHHGVRGRWWTCPEQGVCCQGAEETGSQRIDEGRAEPEIEF